MLQSREGQSTNSSGSNMDIQVASVSRDSARKKGLKKSMKFPKLFSRFFRPDSKLDDESADTSKGDCSAEMTLKTSKSKNSRWTNLMMRLTSNRIPSTSQQSESSSFVSFRHASLYPNRRPTTFQLGRASISKSRQLPTSQLPKDRASNSNHGTVAGSVRKSYKGRRTIPASHQIRTLSETLTSSALPRVVGSIDDDFALVVYPKREPSTKVPSRCSNKNVIQKRHPENTQNSKKLVQPFKYQQTTRSTIIKSSQTATSSKLDPFGDIPPISVPVLEPIRVKPPSWRKIQRKFSKRVTKRQIAEPMKISYSNQNEASADNSVPGQSSMSSNESYPFGDVPFIRCPVLEPVCAEFTTPPTSPIRNAPRENLPNIKKTTSQPSNLNRTSSKTGKCEKSVVKFSGEVIRSDRQFQFARSSERRSLVFNSMPEPTKISALIAMSNFGVDGTTQIGLPASFSTPQFQESNYNDGNVYEARCHADSTPVVGGHLLQASSNHTFSQPASTRVQSEETPDSLPTRDLQLISRLKSLTLGSRNSDPRVDVKSCPESTGVDSSSVVHSLSELDSECAGQVFTSTSTFSEDLPEKKVLKMVPGISSTDALTSVLSSASTSSSANALELTDHTKSAHSAKSTFVSEPSNSGQLCSTSVKTEASKPCSVRREGSLRAGTARSSFSSSSTIFKNSTETINSTPGHKNISVSLTNLLLADSTTSESVGSDAGDSCDLGRINAKGHDEIVASNSLAAVEYSDSHNANGESSSLVRQKSIKMNKIKVQSKRRFFGKLMSAFSTTDKNEYKEFSEPLAPRKKKLVRISKKNPKADHKS